MQPEPVEGFCRHQNFKDWRWEQCRNRAKRDGYCNIHHPDAVEARREKSRKRYQQRQEQQKAVRKAQDAKVVRAWIDDLTDAQTRLIMQKLMGTDWSCDDVRAALHATLDSGGNDDLPT